MSFLESNWYGKRRRSIAEVGATAREAETGRAIAPEGVWRAAIVELTGLSYPAVRLAIDLYDEGGAAALKPTPRGRVPGDGRRLNAGQEDAIRRTICDKRPEQLKMEFALWTRGAVIQFIEQEYGVKLSIRAVGDYLKRWGFTPQKRIKRAYEQRPEAVQQWFVIGG